MDALTRNDLDQLRLEIRADIAEVKAEMRQDMVTHIRWLAGLFIVQFIATVGATTGLVSFIINTRLP